MKPRLTELAKCLDCPVKFTRLLSMSHRCLRCRDCQKAHKVRLQHERDVHGRPCKDCGAPALWRKARCSKCLSARKKELARLWYAAKGAGRVMPVAIRKHGWMPRNHSDGLSILVCRCGRSYACSPASGAQMCPACALQGMPDSTPVSRHVLADL